MALTFSLRARDYSVARSRRSRSGETRARNPSGTSTPTVSTLWTTDAIASSSALVSSRVAYAGEVLQSITQSAVLSALQARSTRSDHPGLRSLSTRDLTVGPNVTETNELSPVWIDCRLHDTKTCHRLHRVIHAVKVKAFTDHLLEGVRIPTRIEKIDRLEPMAGFA